MDIYNATITHKHMGRIIIDVVAFADHEQALAEKDREIAKWNELVGSFTQSEHKYLKKHEQLKKAYTTLMEKAVRFAETVVKIHDFYGVESSDIESSMFLQSPEVQAWKEQQK